MHGLNVNHYTYVLYVVAYCISVHRETEALMCKVLSLSQRRYGCRVISLGIMGSIVLSLS